MLFSELIGKKVFSSLKARGVCRGVSLSLRSFAIRSLLCSGVAAGDEYTEYAVPVSAIERFSEDGIFLKRMRTATPKNCVRFFFGRPVYSDTGVYLGVTADLEFEDFTALFIQTDGGKRYPLPAVAAIGDAVLLKKAPLFPLGVKIPPSAPLFEKGDKKFVTLGVLRSAIEQGALVRFTLSLLPV